MQNPYTDGVADMQNTVEHVLAAQNLVGEGPVWNVNEQALYWVDIEGHTVHRLQPETGEHRVFDVGVAVGVLAFRQGSGFVLATKNGFATWDTETQVVNFLVNPEQGQMHKRFNDGAVDCRGRFWAATMSEEEEKQKPEGVLYRLDPDGSVSIMETGFIVPNGIGWSPDNTHMYVTDSPRHIIYMYDFDQQTGAIDQRRTFVYTPDEQGVPDGLTVDSEGYVWSAYWGGAKIVRYDPSGTVERVISMPVLQPSSCVFGGKNLDELYITSAERGLSDEQRKAYPLSGDLFCLKTDIKGLEKFSFAG